MVERGGAMKKERQGFGEEREELRRRWRRGGKSGIKEKVKTKQGEKKIKKNSTFSQILKTEINVNSS